MSTRSIAIRPLRHTAATTDTVRPRQRLKRKQPLCESHTRSITSNDASDEPDNPNVHCANQRAARSLSIRIRQTAPNR